MNIWMQGVHKALQCKMNRRREERPNTVNPIGRQRIRIQVIQGF